MAVDIILSDGSSVGDVREMIVWGMDNLSFEGVGYLFYVILGCDVGRVANFCVVYIPRLTRWINATEK